MYKVFNMGHRMEIYVKEAFAQQIIDISRSFNIEAQIIGKCELFTGKKVSVETEHGKFEYEG